MEGQGKPIPHGFKSAPEFQEFGRRLRIGLPEGTQPLLQGSSVTGRSYRSGEPFDEVRQSDLDVALVGLDLFEGGQALGLKAKDGTRIGPLSPQDLSNLGLLGLRDQLTAFTGRPVNFMLFASLEAALKRPSIWVA
ncbi:MAG: hypothetical protein ABI353_01390 [Isosphaeraceae bacterium]